MIKFPSKYSTNEIIKSIGDEEFKKKIDDIWKTASIEIHPFQKGDSHQGSEHCIHVLHNLSNLISKKNLSDIEKFLLCCTAILHDIDKAVIDYEIKVGARNLHGIVGAEFIRAHYETFHLSIEEARAIAYIVSKHGISGFDDNLEPYRNFQLPDIAQTINLPMLSAVFKLADMMDVSHKRISKTIIRLNYPEGLNNPKLVAREMLNEYSINDSHIDISTMEVKDCLEYQSILIAVDMMNQELQSTGTLEMLRSNGYPYQFRLSDPILSNGTVRVFKENRDMISKFDENGRLTLDNPKSSKLMEVYEKFPNSLNFSKGELEQLKPLNQYLYSKMSRKSINFIAKKMRAHFGYSIDELTIIRQLNRDSSIKCSLEYKGIKKPKGMNISLSYSSTEVSVKAKYIANKCATSYATECLYVEQIKPNSIGINGRFAWEDTNGYSRIDKLECSFEVENGFAFTRDQVKEFYPKDLDFYENFSYIMMYPICKLNIILEFPLGYNINPKCCRIIASEPKEELDYNYDKAKNKYLIEILNQDVMEIEKSPIYDFKWDIPDEGGDENKDKDDG